MVENKLMLNLKLFDGEGASPAAAGGEASGDENGNVSAAGRQRAKNPLASVQYGKEAEGEEEEAAAPEEADNEETEEPESFDSLIQGKYKKDFESRVQQVINRRFRETKELEAVRAKTEPILEILAEKYGLDLSDLDGIHKAMEGDDALYEQAAMDHGMTTDQYRELSNVRAENRRLRERQEEALRRQRAGERIAQLRNECESLRGIYPNIDFDEEMQNPAVTRLLSANLDFRTAFEAAHMHDIMQGTIRYAVQKTREDTARNIRTRQARPAEEGSGSRVSPPAKRDVSKLTKADRAEIARRAAAGAHISF